MDKKKLIILILLIAIGVVFQILIQDGLNLFNKGINYDLVDKSSPNSFSLKEQRFNSLTAINLNNIAGDVFVERSENNSSYINSKIMVFHKDKKEAEIILKSVSVSIKKTENILEILSGSLKEFQFNRVRLEFYIKLSNKTNINIINANGVVKISDINSPINITSKNGQIMLSKIEGKVFIKKAIKNEITILDCSDIVANFVNSKASISNSTGNIELFSKGGKIRIDSINTEKKIRIVSKQSRISLSNIINTSININIIYEDIYIKNLSSSKIDLFLKNSNLVIDPISKDSINKTSINARDSKILLKYSKEISPKYIIDLYYGKITGDISDLKVTQSNNTEKTVSETGNPEFIIMGKYTDVKIKKKQ